jgi:hypothetical protein
MARIRQVMVYIACIAKPDKERFAVAENI